MLQRSRAIPRDIQPLRLLLCLAALLASESAGAASLGYLDQTVEGIGENYYDVCGGCPPSILDAWAAPQAVGPALDVELVFSSSGASPTPAIAHSATSAHAADSFSLANTTAVGSYGSFLTVGRTTITQTFTVDETTMADFTGRLVYAGFGGANQGERSEVILCTTTGGNGLGLCGGGVALFLDWVGSAGPGTTNELAVSHQVLLDAGAEYRLILTQVVSDTPTSSGSLAVALVPEPSTALLLGTGLGLLGTRRRRARHTTGTACKNGRPGL